MSRDARRTRIALFTLGVGLLAVPTAANLAMLGAPQEYSPAGGTPVAEIGDAVGDLHARINALLNLAGSTLVHIDVPAELGVPHQIPVVLGDQTLTLDLAPHSVRAPNHQVLVQIADGSLVEVKSEPDRTFRGYVVEAPEAVAAASLLPEGLLARIRYPDGADLWIEPIADKLPGAPPSLHVVYRSDELLGAPGVCGNDETAPAPADLLQTGGGASGEGGIAGGLPCVAQLACDADVEYYQSYGSSIPNVQNRINAVTNANNVQYEAETGITHTITTIIVRTAEPDPYSSSDSLTLVTQFRNHWNANHGNVVRDLAQLFTGRDVSGSVIGRAFAIGVVCTDQAYCFAQSDCCGSFACATDLSAHEMGHLWAGTHCSCSSPPTTMNPVLTCANTFATVSRNEITGHRNSRTCLDCGAAGPANDNCANAITISDGSTNFDTTGATTDGPNEPGACNFAGYTQVGSDIWYRYIPACSGVVTVDICNSSFDNKVAVYAGNCPTSASAIACNDDACGTSGLRARLTFNATGGTSYLIRIGGFNGLTGTGTLVVSNAASGPANDACANAAVLGNTTVNGTTTCATNDGTASCGSSATSPDVWYVYTAAATGQLSLNTCGSSFDTVLSVHSACGGAQLACNDDCGGAPCGGLNSCLTLNVTGGTSYRIRVAGFNGATGNFSLTAALVAAGPPNDACANATPITDGTYAGTLVGATNDGSASCGSSSTNADVWYTYTSTCAGTLRINTCGTHDAAGQDTGTDTVLSAHSGCPGTTANQLACNDDYPSGNDPAACNGLDQGVLRDSAISLAVTAGQTVLIRVSKFSTVAAGPFSLTADFVVANDLCANATPIGDGTYPFSTCGATTDGPAEPGACNFFNEPQIGSDIWYRYTASCTGTATATLCGSGYDTEIAIYGATCPTAGGSVLACNDDSCGLQSNVSFAVAAGQQYLVRIGGYNGATGSGTLTVSCAASNPCGSYLRGDADGSGAINNFDIDPFVLAVSNPAGYIAAFCNGSAQCHVCRCDIDGDNSVNNFDIDPFVNCLNNAPPPGQGCP